MVVMAPPMRLIPKTSSRAWDRSKVPYRRGPTIPMSGPARAQMAREMKAVTRGVFTAWAWKRSSSGCASCSSRGNRAKRTPSLDHRLPQSMPRAIRKAAAR